MTTISKAKIEPKNCLVAKASVDDSAKIASAYRAALGENGIGAPGCEPYPDPDLFQEKSVRETIESGERQLITIKHEELVLGAIVADQVHEYAFEFNSMAIDKAYRGLGLGSILIEGAKKITGDCFFISNVTELVTHSLASQSAHIKHGYKKFLGFGYSHFPKVFFADRPESVLWAGQLQGKVVEKLESLRKKPDTEYGDTQEEKNLVKALVKVRKVYLPGRYKSLVREILDQYKPALEYVLEDSLSKDCELNDIDMKVEFMPDYAHSYIDFGYGFDLNRNKNAVLDEINRIKNSDGKRFIRATIAANQPQAIEIAQLLKEEGFVFHSLLPLYGYDKNKKTNEPEFYDLIALQWVKKEIVESNPLPGNTDSVIKVYGYPLGLPGRIVKQIDIDFKNLS